jgi:hypothetical protein
MPDIILVQNESLLSKFTRQGQAHHLLKLELQKLLSLEKTSILTDKIIWVISLTWDEKAAKRFADQLQLQLPRAIYHISLLEESMQPIYS